MAMRGGYQIVNFGGFSLTSGESATIDGIAEQAQSAYGKPTLISGLVVGGVAYPDFFAPFVSSTDTYTADMVIGTSSITIEVESNDGVTVTVA